MSPYLRAAEGDPAELRPEESVQIVIDGESVEALPGQTVAAALMADGKDSWRTTRTGGRPRGVFCGIGACFDCLVVVNGIPDVRACQRTITAGDTITMQPGAALPFAPDPLASVEPCVIAQGSTDATGQDAVVVVGAGPAGMGAALAAADAGAEVVLVDAAASVGGQFHRQLPAEFNAKRPERLQHNWESFARQRDRIAGHSRITHLTSTSVWAIEPLAPAGEPPAGESFAPGGWRVWVQVGAADAPGRRVRAVDGRALVLATGAYDRVLPFSGWDLPGVYSAGAAQALAKGQRIAVGKRVLVAGTGPFLLPVAESLVGVGAEVVGLLEANRPRTAIKGWLSDPLVSSSKLTEAIGYGALLVRHRIPLRYGRTVIAAHGTDRVEAVTTARLDATWQPIPGTEERIEVDAVCLGFGFTAQLELAISARCELGTGPDGGPAVLVDENQQTSASGVFAAGELTGIGGADLAAAEGRVAGAAAAGITGTTAERKKVAKGKRFAVALAKAYPVKPGWQSWSDGGTLVCRCEEVSRDDVQNAVTRRDVSGSRSLKLTSRAGLGLCQGRVCSRTVAELAAAYQPGVRADPIPSRPIAVPVRLRDLAAAETQEEL